MKALNPWRLLRLPVARASFERLGFAPCEPERRAALERVLEVFVAGFNRRLEEPDDAALVAALADEFDDHHVGFAFEGVGMALALQDLLLPRRHCRLARFTAGVGAPHDYIATVGAGFAFARVPGGLRRMPAYLRRLDPMLAWCIADGYGFHEGIFRRRRYFENGTAPPPATMQHWERQLFDSGLGRSLWWSEGADAERIRAAIDRFEPQRRAEMWCGIGVACCYAGGSGEGGAERLLKLAGPYRADLLSGVPFAARMRQKGANPSVWSERLCRRWTSLSIDQAADLIVDRLDRIARRWADAEEDRGGRSYLLLRETLTEMFRAEPWVARAATVGT